MYSTLSWVGRGLLRQYPTFDISDDEDNEDFANTAPHKKNPLKGLMNEPYEMDNYEDEDASMLKILEMSHTHDKDVESFDSEEEEALPILPTDCPLVGLLSDVDSASLELYIYDEENGSLYIHHDVLIPENPLCCDFIQTQNGSNNLIAIGDMSSVISFWDLDCIDKLEPLHTLPKNPTKNSHTHTKKKKKMRKLNDTHTSNNSSTSTHLGHTGAVLTLQTSPLRKNILCSGSEDQTTRIWDISTYTCLSTHHLHKDKVQSIKWHPIEEFVVVSSSFDKRAVLLDVRQPNGLKFGKLPSEAECVLWSQHNPNNCLISCENGDILSYDIRYISESKKKAKIFHITAHEEATTSIADCKVANLLVSCSADGTAKVWDMRKFEEPQIIHEKDLKSGPIMTCQNNPNISELFAFGGENVVLWDILESDNIRNAFNLN